MSFSSAVYCNIYDYALLIEKLILEIDLFVRHFRGCQTNSLVIYYHKTVKGSD